MDRVYIFYTAPGAHRQNVATTALIIAHGAYTDKIALLQLD